MDLASLAFKHWSILPALFLKPNYVYRCCLERRETDDRHESNRTGKERPATSLQGRRARFAGRYEVSSEHRQNHPE